MSLQLVIDNTRPRPPGIPPTDCFVDGNNHPIAGTPAPAPYPFCGSGAAKLFIERWGDFVEPVDATYNVECDGCHCEGPGAATQLEAAQGWNRRAGEVQP